jgi:FixJ family two-component response regulator
MGFHVETFASAEEFLEANQLTKADCLVFDVHLSGISGLELQQLLDARGINPPIIFISADADLTEQQLIQANAVAYLPKPVEDAALISAIQHAIAGRHN